jgi:magnesium chelatase family protein
MLGCPGAGTSRLARRLTTILPAITLAESFETRRMHHLVSLTGERTAWVTAHLFRAPRHTMSDVGLIGGG